MNLSLIIFFFLTILNANDSLVSGIGLLGQLNTESVNQSPDQCFEKYNYLFGVSEDEEFQNCAIELCGKPKEAVTTALTNSNFDRYVQLNDMEQFKKYEPILTQLIDFEFQRNQKFINALKNKTQNKKSLDINFKKWTDRDYERVASRLFQQNIRYKADKSKPDGKRLSYVLVFPNGASETFKAGLEAFASTEIINASSSKEQGILEGLYTLEESKSYLFEKFKIFESQLKEKRKYRPNLMDSFQEDLVNLQSRIDNDEFENLYDVKYGIRELMDFEDAVSVETVGQLAYQRINLCSSRVCKKAVREIIGQIDVQKFIEEFEKENANKKESIDELVTYCQSTFAMNSIADYDLNSIKKTLPQLKERFLNKFFVGFSEESKKRFGEYLDNKLNISFDENNNFVEEYVQEINSDFERMNSIMSAVNFDDFSKNQFLEKILGYKSKGEGVDPMAYFYTCSGDFDNLAVDYFVESENIIDPTDYPSDVDPKKDNLVLSPFSCTNQKHGEGIISHELGHALSFAFKNKKLSSESYKKYLELRKCASQTYKTNFADVRLSTYEHEGDFFRTEEDAADIVSDIVNSDQPFLYRCSLLIPSADEETYSSLELINKNPMDNHSSSLLRILQEAISKKRELPGSCQSIVDKYKNQIRFQSCL